jgi:outer membrane protein OmpA-like peptidoglycan-associated protein
MLCWLAVQLERSAIEADLERRSAAVLSATGHDWAVVAFDGRDGLLAGHPDHAEQRQEALALVRSVWGVRVVRTQPEAAAASSPSPHPSPTSPPEPDTGPVISSSQSPTTAPPARRLERAISDMPFSSATSVPAPAPLQGNQEPVTVEQLSSSSSAIANLHASRLRVAKVVAPVESHPAGERHPASLPVIAARDVTPAVPDAPTEAEAPAASAAAMTPDVVAPSDAPGPAPSAPSAAAPADEEPFSIPAADAHKPATPDPKPLVISGDDSPTVAAQETQPALAEIAPSVQMQEQAAPAAKASPAPPTDLNQPPLPEQKQPEVHTSTPQPPTPADTKLSSSDVHTAPPVKRFDTAALPPGNIDAAGGCLEQVRGAARRVEVHFARGAAGLDTSGKALIDGLIGTLNICPEATLRISGHADASGKARHNQVLSRHRARGVVSYMTHKGIDAGRLVAVGYGDKQPVAPNDSQANRARNRRIELTVSARTAPLPPMPVRKQGTRNGLSNR